jgi:hypothetical protein
MVTTERVIHQQCCDDPLNPPVSTHCQPFMIMKIDFLFEQEKSGSGTPLLGSVSNIHAEEGRA